MVRQTPHREPGFNMVVMGGGGGGFQYDELKRMIRVLAEVESKSMVHSPPNKIKPVSLTVPRPTNAAAQPTLEYIKADQSDGEWGH